MSLGSERANVFIDYRAVGDRSGPDALPSYRDGGIGIRAESDLTRTVPGKALARERVSRRARRLPRLRCLDGATPPSLSLVRTPWLSLGPQIGRAHV